MVGRKKGTWESSFWGKEFTVGRIEGVRWDMSLFFFKTVTVPSSFIILRILPLHTGHVCFLWIRSNRTLVQLSMHKKQKRWIQHCREVYIGKHLHQGSLRSRWGTQCPCYSDLNFSLLILSIWKILPHLTSSPTFCLRILRNGLTYPSNNQNSQCFYFSSR